MQSFTWLETIFPETRMSAGIGRDFLENGCASRVLWFRSFSAAPGVPPETSKPDGCIVLKCQQDLWHKVSRPSEPPNLCTSRRGTAIGKMSVWDWIAASVIATSKQDHLFDRGEMNAKNTRCPSSSPIRYCNPAAEPGSFVCICDTSCVKK